MNANTNYLSFRMTPTPPLLIPEPPVARAEVVRVKGPWIELRYTGDTVSAPEAMYNHEFWDTDPSDPDQIVALVGALELDLVPVKRDRWRDVRSPQQGTLPFDVNAAYQQNVSNWAEALGFSDVEGDPHFGPKYARSELIAIHVAEVAYRVWTMKSLVAAASGDARVRTSPYGNSEFPSAIERLLDSSIAAMGSLMLTPFAPRFQLTGNVQGGADERQVEERRGWPPTAFEVAALQLFNDLKRKPDFTFCSFCERPFLFQRGRGLQERSTAGRRRDVLYCKKQCGQAKAQANLRLRRRASVGPAKANNQREHS